MNALSQSRNGLPGSSSPLFSLIAPNGNTASEDTAAEQHHAPRTLRALEPLTLPSEFGDPTVTDVVDRRELSLAEISQMRLSGCRAHCRHSPCSTSLSCVAAGAPGPSLVLQSRSFSSATPPAAHTARIVEGDGGSSAPVPRPTGFARGQRSESPNARLSTSMRILERMALDTAASTYGRSGAGGAGSGMTGVADSSALGAHNYPRHSALASNGVNANHLGPSARTTPLLRVTTTYTTDEERLKTALSPADLVLVSSSSGMVCSASGEVGGPPCDAGSEPRPSRRQQNLFGTPDTDASTPTNAADPDAAAPLELPGFAETAALVDDSLDNTTSVTPKLLASVSTTEGKDPRGGSPGSNRSKPGSSMRSGADDALAVPPVLATSYARRTDPAARVSGQVVLGQGSPDSSTSCGPNLPSRGEGRHSLNGSTQLHSRSPHGSSVNRPPPAALSVSELLLGHQINQSSSTPRRTHSATCSTTTGPSVSGGQWPAPLSAGAGYPWLERRKLNNLNASNGSGLTTTTTTLEQLLHHSNHDLQRILSREDKEALTISVQPYEEVDEDAEVDPLHITTRSRKCSQQTAVGKEANEAAAEECTGSVSVSGSGGRDGDGDGLGGGSKSRAPCSPSLPRWPAKPTSHYESRSPTLVQPFQTWRFPLLGKSDSPLCSPQVDLGAGGFQHDSRTSSVNSPVRANTQVGACRPDGGAGAGEESCGSAASSEKPCRPAAGAPQQKRRDSWSHLGPLGCRSGGAESAAPPAPAHSAEKPSSSSRHTVIPSSDTALDHDANTQSAASAGEAERLCVRSGYGGDRDRSDTDGGHSFHSAMQALKRYAGNPNFVRRFEVVYAAYAKNRTVRDAEALGGNSGTTVTTMISPYSSLAATPCVTTQGRRVSFSVMGPQSSVDPYQRHTAGAAAMPYSPRPQAEANPGQPSAVTPGASISGGLGRSAGYYSFGNRLSLHHPNRQSVPSTPQELQSFGHVHTGLRSYLQRSASVEALHSRPGDLARSGAAAAAAAAASSSECLSFRRRTLDTEIVKRIARRPLLQTTVFLYYAQAQLREVHEQRLHEAASLAQGASGGKPSLLSQSHHRMDDGSGSAAPMPQSRAEPGGGAANSAEVGSKPNHVGSIGDGHVAAGSAADQPPCQPEECPPMERERPTPQHQNPSAPGFAYSPSPPLPCFHRALTPFKRLVRHVHSIDGCEREVDNENSDLVVYTGMRLMGWLEVVSLLGRGSFGQVFLCKDLRISNGLFVRPSEIDGDDYAYWNCCHAYLPFGDCDTPPTHTPLVAVKVVKSVPLYEQQSVLEAEMLVLIGAQVAKEGKDVDPDTAGLADHSENAAGAAKVSAALPTNPFSPNPPPPDPRCAHVAKVLADGMCFGHHCIVMERYGANIYEYVENNNHSGLPMYQVRSIGRQLLSALTLLHEDCHIIHADIKPENMLLTLDSCRSVMSANQLQASPPQSVVSAAITPQHQPGQQQQQQQQPLSSLSTAPQQQQHEAHTTRSPSCEPPCQQTRREGDGGLERSYIRLSGGAGAAGDSSHEGKTTVLLDAAAAGRCVGAGAAASASGVLKGPNGQSYRQLPLLSCGPSASASIAGTAASTVAAPEPQRVHALNQPRHTASLAAASGQPLEGAGDGGAVASSSATAVASSSAVPRLRIKLIDFSTSCYDGGPFYPYIQSRYYRAPEVILQAHYGSPIDLWSTGCVLAELFLGMPVLPGSNDHHQLSLIEEMLGPLPEALLEEGVATHLFYEHAEEGQEGTGKAGARVNASRYRLITSEEFFCRNNTPPVTYTRYFNFKTLQELARFCPLAVEERRMCNGEQPYPPAVPTAAGTPVTGTPATSQISAFTATVRSELMKQRFYLSDLLRQLLNPDPSARPTAAVALTHPFFATTPTYMKAFALD